MGHESNRQHQASDLARDESGLIVPPRAAFSPRCVSEQYGAGHVLSAYAGVSWPRSFHARWQHGWAPRFRQVDPTLVIQERSGLNDRILVGRPDEVRYLKAHGYRRVHAIGLPMAYVGTPAVQRVHDGLLVMPAHSLPYTTHHWRFDEYVEQIDAIRNQFARVVACVHPSCFDKGYWVPQFRSAGIEVVAGADPTDANALIRMATICSQFEFMTTNQVGSHVAYAAYWGCRPSVYGTYAEPRYDDLESAPLYRDDPALLRASIESRSRAVANATFPFLFRHPRRAPIRTSWGAEQVGRCQRRTPAEIRRMLGWTLRARIRGRATQEARRLMGRGRRSWVPKQRHEDG
jgi:hypothetical protein